MAAALIIALFFVLFTAFKNKESWAWWLFLFSGLVAWGYGVISQILEGDMLNFILQTIGFIIFFVALFLPVKQFFGEHE